MTLSEHKTDYPSRLAPSFHGKRWIDVQLPNAVRDWSRGGVESIVTEEGGGVDLINALGRLNEAKAWRWPARPQLFFSDLHADADAFAASLVASGAVKKTGPGPRDFRLRKPGREARFVVGGDCFDKGPNNLDLLRTIQYLKSTGARVRILAGNHDVRLLFGMQVVGEQKDLRNEHFFVRTGQKIIPLLREIWDEYLERGVGLKNVPSLEVCRRRLLPRSSWYEEFSRINRGELTSAQVEREVRKIARKQERFESLCEEAGLSLRNVYAAVKKWRSLFLKKHGEFRWFYQNMRLCYRSGSFLFIHAGVDDTVAGILAAEGVKPLNRAFRRAMVRAPFDFYYGPICNTIRTKYREVDRPFSSAGAKLIGQAGITAIVHGHRNLHHGQRISLRNSLLNFECDTSLDRHTRRMENVGGRGASVTIVDPNGHVLGISSDYPAVKVFHPQKTLKKLSQG